jgi:integrase
MARRTLTDISIAALKGKPKRYAIPDPKLAGHYVRVTPLGSKSFVAVARDPRGKQVWHTIGSTDLHKLEEARELARAAMKAIKAGADRAGPQSFQAVADEWLKRHVEAKGLLTANNLKRLLDNHILPTWGGREFTSIRRADVARLLDTVQDTAGPTAADCVLGVIRAIGNWYSIRSDDYVSPVVRGMRRTNPKERARERILSDDEIRVVWEQSEANGTFGALIRILLLTGQRRTTVAAMRWQDISLDGVWTIPNGARRKGTGRELALPESALAIVRGQTRFVDNLFVFAGRGKRHYNSYSKAKVAFDAKLPDMPQWGLHDLRRTARSLMSRAGVRPDIAERVLGHAIQGVEGVYDRHSYREEKAQALKALAGLIETILRGPADNVVVLRG